jgi:PAS domain S-box-containing protein
MNYKKTTAIVSILLLFMFCIFIIIYERYTYKEAQGNIDKHARVIVNSLWNFNPQGASEYLSLACKLQNYQYVIVMDNGGEVFQKVLGTQPKWLENFFLSLHLIPLVHLKSDIVYNDQMIGEISAIWRCNTIYKELLVLFVTVLLFLILQLYIRLLYSKRILEERVLERTRELSMLNDSLEIEVKEHRQAKEDLFQSEERYRLIAENAADVIWVTNMDLKFTYVSPSILQQRGYTNKEAIEQSVDEIMTPASLEKVMNIYSKRLKLIHAGDPKGWESIIFEIEQYCKDGSTIWTSNNARFLKGEDKQPKGILGVTHDISMQMIAEKEKIRAERHAAKQEKHALVGQVAGKMSHDFNNILSVIMGNAELSLIDCKDKNIKNTLELILGQTLRGKNLTKNLIAFAKDQEPNQEFFQINDKIDLVVKLLKKDLEGIEILTEKTPTLPLLLADSGMIEHALVNLLQNSIHALSAADQPMIIIRSYFFVENIYIEIQDNGCGIPKEHLDNIYEPSFTLKGNKDITGSYKSGIKGTGYGMANVIKYIDQHDGTISVESNLNSGTKFTISLPVTQKELSIEEKTEIEKQVTFSKKNILLVEDEQTISDVQCSILTQNPFKHIVDVAINGQVAMNLFEENHYDLVSLDYVLQGNINGMDVYNHIRNTNKTIPVLFISGNIEFLESIQTLKNKDPYVAHLSKPCKNIDYVNCINKLMSRVAI